MFYKTKITHHLTIILIVFIGASLKATTATIPHYKSATIVNSNTKIENQKKHLFSTTNKNHNKGGFINKWLKKLLIKKLQKNIKNENVRKYNHLSKWSLILNAIAVIGFWPLLFVSINPIVTGAIIALLFATIVADIFSIYVRAKTRKNKTEYKKERTLSLISLILGSLIIITPAIGIIILFINFFSG